jgi:hypothetical protein
VGETATDHIQPTHRISLYFPKDFKMSTFACMALGYGIFSVTIKVLIILGVIKLYKTRQKKRKGLAFLAETPQR